MHSELAESREENKGCEGEHETDSRLAHTGPRSRAGRKTFVPFACFAGHSGFLACIASVQA